MSLPFIVSASSVLEGTDPLILNSQLVSLVDWSVTNVQVRAL